MPHIKLPLILGNADGHEAPLTPLMPRRGSCVPGILWSQDLYQGSVPPRWRPLSGDASRLCASSYRRCA
jgi:hypothetical protein